MAKIKKVEGKTQKRTTRSPKSGDKLIEEGPVPAVVEACLGRSGTRGEITQVKVRILQVKIGENYEKKC